MTKSRNSSRGAEPRFCDQPNNSGERAKHVRIVPSEVLPLLGRYLIFLVGRVKLRHIHKKRALKKALFINGRDDTIRTCDPFVPSEVRYQTAPHPDTIIFNFHSGSSLAAALPILSKTILNRFFGRVPHPDTLYSIFNVSARTILT